MLPWRRGFIAHELGLSRTEPELRWASVAVPSRASVRLESPSSLGPDAFGPRKRRDRAKATDWSTPSFAVVAGPLGVVVMERVGSVFRVRRRWHGGVARLAVLRLVR
jgi:hypothetical protein